MCSSVRSSFRRRPTVKTGFLCSNVSRRVPAGRFYFRVRVPPDLIPVVRAKELRFSLRTRLLAEAMSCADGTRRRLVMVFTFGRTHVLTDEQTRDLPVASVRTTHGDAPERDLPTPH